MQEVQRGETMSQSGPEGLRILSPSQSSASAYFSTDHIEAALSFYKALKVYPQPMDLMSYVAPFFQTCIFELEFHGSDRCYLPD